MYISTHHHRGTKREYLLQSVLNVSRKLLVGAEYPILILAAKFKYNVANQRKVFKRIEKLFIALYHCKVWLYICGKSKESFQKNRKIISLQGLVIKGKF